MRYWRLVQHPPRPDQWNGHFSKSRMQKINSKAVSGNHRLPSWPISVWAIKSLVLPSELPQIVTQLHHSLALPGGFQTTLPEGRSLVFSITQHSNRELATYRCSIVLNAEHQRGFVNTLDKTTTPEIFLATSLPYGPTASSVEIYCSPRTLLLLRPREGSFLHYTIMHNQKSPYLRSVLLVCSSNHCSASQDKFRAVSSTVTDTVENVCTAWSQMR